MNRIRTDAILGGSCGAKTVRALVDTGAAMSLLPKALAREVGAQDTGFMRLIKGVNDNTGQMMPVVTANLGFQDLQKNVRACFVVSAIEQEVIIGMDILGPTGISVDTAARQLTIRHQAWEAFKTVTACGAVVLAALKLVDALTEE